MTHLPLAGPFSELDLAYESRPDPCCLVLVRNVRKRLRGCSQLHHTRVQSREHRSGESPAAVADINELALVVDAQHQRAKILPAAAWLGEADDNGFLLVAGL